MFDDLDNRGMATRVSVKPLQWRVFERDGEIVGAESVYDLVGYCARKMPDGRWSLIGCPDGERDCKTRVDALEAAQADYEQRILDWVVVEPEAEGA